MNENERGSRTARSRSRRVCLRSADPPRARWLPGSLRVKPEAASPLLTWGNLAGPALDPRAAPIAEHTRAAGAASPGPAAASPALVCGAVHRDVLRRPGTGRSARPRRRPACSASARAPPGFRWAFPKRRRGQGRESRPAAGPRQRRGGASGLSSAPPVPPVRAQGRAGMRGPAPILTLAPSSSCAPHDRGQKRAEESCFSPRPNPVLASKGVRRILGRARWDAQTALSFLSFRRACVFALVCLCFKLRLIYRVVFVSAVRRSDSVIRIHFEESFPMGLS